MCVLKSAPRKPFRLGSFLCFRVGLSLRGTRVSSQLSPVRLSNCLVFASSWPSGLVLPLPPAGTNHLRLSDFLFLSKSPHWVACLIAAISALYPLSQQREAWRRLWSTWWSYSSQLACQLPKGNWAAFLPFPHLEHIAICFHILSQPSSCYIMTAVSFFKWLHMCFIFQKLIVAL